MKWIRTALCALGMLACLSLSAFAAELGEPNITEQTTMKELRENPSIKGSGFYTYCNEWIEGSTKYDNTPIKGYVSWAASEDAAEGMNLVIENYNKGVQVTWQVYTPEEIEADPALGMVQLFYFPAKTENAKYVVVVPGNGGNTTAELNEGASIANQLHDLGYAVFVLRYRSFLNASDNAPLYDIANAVKYLTKNAEQFGVQRENYALMGFSSGGHIVGLIGSDNERFGYKAFGIPQAAVPHCHRPAHDQLALLLDQHLGCGKQELHPHLLLVRQKRLLHGVHELRKAGPPVGKDPEGERCDLSVRGVRGRPARHWPGPSHRCGRMDQAGY